MRLAREQALLLGDFVKATRAWHTKGDTKATGGPLPFARAVSYGSFGFPLEMKSLFANYDAANGLIMK